MPDIVIKGKEHEYKYNPELNSYNFDFDVEAFTWTGAQQPYYSITAQLVTYGDYNFNTDAELSEIISPNNHEEFKRYNPTSAHPIVEIKNNNLS